jgi:hypothetical protein
MAAHRAFLLLAALALALLAGAAPRPVDSELLEGRAPTPEELRPSVEAAFGLQSYRPGDTASLVLFNRAPGLTVQILQSGPEHTPTVGYSEMQGVPVTAVRGASGPVVRVRIGDWPSGLYFARLTSSDGRLGFAPFVVRPRRFGEHRIAVVMPTLTWQAYNLRGGGTWYASWKVKQVRLARPFLNRGVPYNFRRYDLPFLNWLAWTGRGVDVLSDADLYRARSGDELARAYDLIVFPGHHEYVTAHEYDVVRRFRDLGGNLAFLSANNFFWRVDLHAGVMTRTREWRDLGKPEDALIGVRYRGNDHGGHRGAWIVRDPLPWLFAGTGLTRGSTFGSGGIEIDAKGPDSPPGTDVVAEIPDLFGKGFTAQMTYYRTARGAQVFAAGAFTLAGAVTGDPVVARLLANLWARLSVKD